MTSLINNSGYWMLPVNISGLPESLELDSKKFIRKQEFHATILTLKHIIVLLTQNNLEIVPEKLSEVVSETIGKYQLSVQNLTADVRHAQEGEKETIIIMCEVENIQALYEDLSRQLECKIDQPPTHITLFTLPPGGSIGIVDQQELASLTTPISDPALTQSLTSLDLKK